MAGVRRGAFTCVGWLVTLCYPMASDVPYSCEMGFPWRVISAFTFFNLIPARGMHTRFSYRKDGRLVHRLECRDGSPAPTDGHPSKYILTRQSGPGIVLAICWSQVRRLNHYTTIPSHQYDHDVWHWLLTRLAICFCTGCRRTGTDRGEGTRREAPLPSARI